MTDIVITAANVVAGTDAARDIGTAGETIVAGKLLWLDPTSGKFMLADNNSATAGARVASAVALNGASLNQPVSVQKSGDITIGATLTPGVVYYTSDTPGGICPVADLATGEYPQIVGIAKSATVLSLGFKSAGVAL